MQTVGQSPVPISDMNVQLPQLADGIVGVFLGSFGDQPLSTCGHLDQTEKTAIVAGRVEADRSVRLGVRCPVNVVAFVMVRLRFGAGRWPEKLRLFKVQEGARIESVERPLECVQGSHDIVEIPSG